MFSQVLGVRQLGLFSGHCVLYSLSESDDEVVYLALHFHGCGMQASRMELFLLQSILYRGEPGLLITVLTAQLVAVNTQPIVLTVQFG